MTNEISVGEFIEIPSHDTFGCIQDIEETMCNDIIIVTLQEDPEQEHDFTRYMVRQSDVRLI